MSMVTVERQGSVAVLRMSRGVTNAIDLELVTELARAIEEARHEARGLVLAGGDKFFSIGLNLPAMLGEKRASLLEFWSAYNRLCLDLYTMPMPTVSAIRGHAIAGGTIMALMTDRRFIASGRKLTGLNEIRIGLPVPLLPHLVLRDVAGERASTEITQSGELYEAEAALDLGLVDEVCAIEDVEPRAIAWAEALGSLPRAAFAAIKQTRTEAVTDAFRRDGVAKTEEFLDCWESPETTALLEDAAKKF